MDENGEFWRDTGEHGLQHIYFQTIIIIIEYSLFVFV